MLRQMEHIMNTAIGRFKKYCLDSVIVEYNALIFLIPFGM